MNDFEQQYLPEAYRPLSPWTYFGLSILYAVPVIGWVFLIAHAVASRNINKRNYARSFFCISPESSWILSIASCLASAWIFRILSSSLIPSNSSRSSFRLE